jgi:hypothetical protein
MVPATFSGLFYLLVPQKLTHALTLVATVLLVFDLMPNDTFGRTVLFPLKILARSRMLLISVRLWFWNKTEDWD